MMNELKSNLDTYCKIINQIEQSWKNHRTMIGFCPDHGCHEIDGNLGSHGLDMARGEFIMLLDSDDYMLPNAFDNLYKLLCITGADIATGRMVRIPHTSKYNPDLFQKQCTLDYFRVYERPRNYFIKRAYVSHSTDRSIPFLGKSMFTKNLVKEIRFPIGVHAGEDDVFVAQCHDRATRMAEAESVIYHYRRNPMGLMNLTKTNYARNAINSLKILEFLLHAKFHNKKLRNLLVENRSHAFINNIKNAKDVKLSKQQKRVIRKIAKIMPLKNRLLWKIGTRLRMPHIASFLYKLFHPRPKYACTSDGTWLELKKIR